MGSVLIDPGNQLLIDAILSADSELESRLLSWQDSVQLDEVEGPTFGWLSLLAERLELLDINCKDKLRLAGIKRYIWVANQRALQRHKDLINTVVSAIGPEFVIGGDIALRAHLESFKVGQPIKRFTLYMSDTHADSVIQHLRKYGWTAQPGSVLRPFTLQFQSRHKTEVFFLDIHLTHVARSEHSVMLSRLEVDSSKKKVNQPPPTLTKAQLLFSLLGREQHQDVVRLLPSIVLLVQRATGEDIRQFAGIASSCGCSLRSIVHIVRVSDMYEAPALVQLRSELSLNRTTFTEKMDCFFRYRVSGALCNATDLYVALCRSSNITPNPFGLLRFLINKQRLRLERYSDSPGSRCEHE